MCERLADPERHPFGAGVTREGKWLWAARGVWLGAMAFALSLAGTELLRDESLRTLAVLLIVGAAVLAVLAWSDSQWSSAFPADRDVGSATSNFSVWRRRSSLTLLAGAVLLLALSHVAFLATPRAPFGAAGWLWVGAIALVIAAAARQSSAQPPRDSGAEGLSASSWREVTIVASITVLALALRVSNLRDVPFNIYPDEVMTGLGTERAD